MFAGLRAAGTYLPNEIGKAFSTGLVYLAMGTILACLASYRVLPDFPVTKAEDKRNPQTGLSLYMFVFASYTRIIFCLVPTLINIVFYFFSLD
jgi:succinate-acetate transporter protein